MGDYFWLGFGGFGSGVEVYNLVINNVDFFLYDGIYCVVVEVVGCMFDIVIMDVVVCNCLQVFMISYDMLICLDNLDVVLMLSIDIMLVVVGVNYIWLVNSGMNIVGGFSFDL